MNVLKNNSQSRNEGFASKEDFQNIFLDNIDGLYQIAFLLTGEHEKAEVALVSGLEDSLRSNRVFRNWAGAWARRTVIKTAIALVRPRSTQPSFSATGTLDGQNADAESRTILSLGDFDRFVFVISVLERITDIDCALLLGCSRLEVREARVRALEQLPKQEVKADHSPKLTKPKCGVEPPEGAVSPMRLRSKDCETSVGWDFVDASVSHS